MPISVGWHNSDHTIVTLKFQRGWSWSNLYAALQQADEFIGSVQHTVHLLIDLREGGRLPLDFMSVAGDLFSSGDARPNEGKRVVVGAGRLVRAAYGSLLRVYGSKLAERPIQFADTLEQAIELL